MSIICNYMLCEVEILSTNFQNRKQAVILLHEIYGMNGFIQEQCQKFREAGFDVFCPKMYLSLALVQEQRLHGGAVRILCAAELQPVMARVSGITRIQSLPARCFYYLQRRILSMFLRWFANFRINNICQSLNLMPNMGLSIHSPDISIFSSRNVRRN